MGLLIPHISIYLYGACVWHIWDMVIRLCSYGGIYIYMCVQCVSWYIIVQVHIRYCAYKVVAYTTWTIQACAYDRVYYLICYYLYRYAIAYKGVCAPCMHRCIYVCICVYCMHVQYMSICVSMYSVMYTVQLYVYLCIYVSMMYTCVMCMYVLH